MNQRATTLYPLILKASRLDGKELPSAAAMAQAEQLAEDLIEIPDKWLAKSYEHARIHRRAVPRSIEVIRSWDNDLKAEAYAKPLAAPVAMLAAPVDDCWADLAAHRILKLHGSGMPEPTEWLLRMAAIPPTRQEADGFLRIFGRVRKSDRDPLADHWGAKNPYGLSAEQIKASFATPDQAREPVLEW